MMRIVLLLFLLASGLRLSVSQFQCDSLESRDDRKLSYGLTKTRTTLNCSKWAVIYTNSSTTEENLGVLFWDLHDNQVYVPKLRIWKNTFEQFPVDRFVMTDTCPAIPGNGAVDDWKPHTVRMYDMKFKSKFDRTFSHHLNGRWYGVYICCNCFFLNYPMNTIGPDMVPLF